MRPSEGCRSLPERVENLIEEATRGNVTEVKVVLATVVLAREEADARREEAAERRQDGGGGQR